MIHWKSVTAPRHSWPSVTPRSDENRIFSRITPPRFSSRPLLIHILRTRDTGMPPRRLDDLEGPRTKRVDIGRFSLISVGIRRFDLSINCSNTDTKLLWHKSIKHISLFLAEIRKSFLILDVFKTCVSNIKKGDFCSQLRVMLRWKKLWTDQSRHTLYSFLVLMSDLS